MEKIKELITALDFYVKANAMKYHIIDEVNNYSMADHLFGSFILATAIDSEFKETDSLAKIHRLLFLSEFKSLYPNFTFDKLELGEQFNYEAERARDLNTEEGRLVFKYKMLDFLLTKLIKSSGEEMPQSKLISEGSKIISCLCDKPSEECEEIFKFYYRAFKLKDKVRSGWDDSHWNIMGRRETVSEHIVGTLSLALFIDSEFERKTDIDRVLKMLAIHDVGEALMPDVTPFDGIPAEVKKEMEKKAVRDVLGDLKEKDILYDLWYEFDSHSTLDSLFAFYSDKLDADLQSKIYQEKGLHHSLDDQAGNRVFLKQKSRDMLKNGASSAFDIWYKYDKTIYFGDKTFPEFMNMLNIAKATDLLKLSKVVKEQVPLTNDEHSLLSEQISSTVSRLYEDDEIDSAYLVNYHSPYNTKGTLKVVLLLNYGANYLKYANLIDELNNKMAASNTDGPNVIYSYNYLDRYLNMSSKNGEMYRGEELAESTILFDKSEQLTRIQNTMKEFGHKFDFFLVDYVPPVDHSVAQKTFFLKNR